MTFSRRSSSQSRSWFPAAVSRRYDSNANAWHSHGESDRYDSNADAWHSHGESDRYNAWQRYGESDRYDLNANAWQRYSESIRSLSGEAFWESNEDYGSQGRVKNCWQDWTTEAYKHQWEPEEKEISESRDGWYSNGFDANTYESAAVVVSDDEDFEKSIEELPQKEPISCGKDGIVVPQVESTVNDAEPPVLQDSSAAIQSTMGDMERCLSQLMMLDSAVAMRFLLKKTATYLEEHWKIAVQSEDAMCCFRQLKKCLEPIEGKDVNEIGHVEADPMSATEYYSSETESESDNEDGEMLATSKLMMEAQKCLESEKKRKLGTASPSTGGSILCGAASTSGSIFGGTEGAGSEKPSIFGSSFKSSGGSIFGFGGGSNAAGSGSLFGGSSSSSGSIFGFGGGSDAAGRGSLFGSSSSSSGSIFGFGGGETVKNKAQKPDSKTMEDGEMFATSEQLLMEAQKCLESEKKRKLGCTPNCGSKAKVAQCESTPNCESDHELRELFMSEPVQASKPPPPEASKEKGILAMGYRSQGLLRVSFAGSNGVGKKNKTIEHVEKVVEVPADQEAYRHRGVYCGICEEFCSEQRTWVANTSEGLDLVCGRCIDMHQLEHSTMCGRGSIGWLKIFSHQSPLSSDTRDVAPAGALSPEIATPDEEEISSSTERDSEEERDDRAKVLLESMGICQ